MRLIATLCTALVGMTLFASMAGAEDTLTLYDEAAKAEGLAVGAVVPDAPLTALDGSSTSLLTVLDGPAVVIVFRGGWCPYCTTQLAELRTIEADLTALGVDVIGISPDHVKGLASAADEKDLGYALYSDHTMKAIAGLGLAFTLDKQTITTYRGYGIPLVDVPGTTTPVLPVPAVFVLDGAGTVLWRHYDPDYKVRPSAESVLAAARTALAP